MTAISAGKIYGLSWGNQASSTIFDSSQSATPVIAFLPAAGEVHLTRDGRLLSVQNFTMGNHEVDTRGLPYGIYDVEVEVIVNGRVISKRTQRVNKLFSRGAASVHHWRGRYGAVAFIWIAGRKTGKRRDQLKRVGWQVPRPPAH